MRSSSAFASFILLLSGLFCASRAIAQTTLTESPVWLTPVGDEVRNYIFSLTPAQQNGWLAVGGIVDSQDESAYWFARLDTNGAVLWQQFLDEGADGNALFYSVTPIPGGYMLGAQAVDSTFEGWHEGDASDDDAGLMAIDTGGNILWNHAYGGSAGDALAQVIRTHDGGYAFVGRTSSDDGDISDYKNADTNPADVWIEKVDSGGRPQWEKTYGGSDLDLGVGIAELPDHSFGVIANSRSSDGDVSQHFGQYDIWLLHLDSSGKKLWDHSYGSEVDDEAVGIASTDSGTMLVVGQRNFLDSVGEEIPRVWAAEIDESGHTIWELDSAGWENYLPYAMSPSPDNGLLIAGRLPNLVTSSTPFVTLLDSHSGKVSWRDTLVLKAEGSLFSGPLINAITPSAADGFVCAGDGPLNGIQAEAFITRYGLEPLAVHSQANTNSDIQVFPTPATSMIHIRQSGTACVQHVTLLNAIGASVLMFDLMPTQLEAHLDVSRLPRGVYYIETSSASGVAEYPVVLE